MEINDVIIEPRYVVKNARVVGEVALDNCKYIDPCKRPNTCEHGGKCFVKDDRMTCDCSGTRYIEKNCDFTKYRKICEELVLLGYTKPYVYLIDIDSNGVFPLAHMTNVIFRVWKRQRKLLWSMIFPVNLMLDQ